MLQTFIYQTQVRAYECDSLGHMNNAVYIEHLYEATLDTLGLNNLQTISIRIQNLAIEYHTPAGYGDILEIKVWLVEASASVLVYGYNILRSSDSTLVVAAKISWETDLVQCGAIFKTDQRDRLSPLSRVFKVPKDNRAKPFYWRHRVRHYELGAGEQVIPLTYFNWIEEAFFRAVHVASWPLERLKTENFISFQYRHDAQFFATAGPDDEIEIVSRLVEVRRVRGTWLHQIFRVTAGTLLVQDYSTGAFVDWQGKVRTAPPGLMERLVQGQTES